MCLAELELAVCSDAYALCNEEVAALGHIDVFLPADKADDAPSGKFRLRCRLYLSAFLGTVLVGIDLAPDGVRVIDVEIDTVVTRLNGDVAASEREGFLVATQVVAPSCISPELELGSICNLHVSPEDLLGLVELHHDVVFPVSGKADQAHLVKFGDNLELAGGSIELEEIVALFRVESDVL